MSTLSPEELALFGGEVTPTLAVAEDDWLTVDEEPAPLVPPPRVVSTSPVPVSTPVNDPALPPPPVPSRKLTIQEVNNAPKCMSCGVELNADNGSKNRGGEWKHVGCPAVIPTPVAVVPSSTPAPAPAVTTAAEKPKRGRPAKVPVTVEITALPEAEVKTGVWISAPAPATTSSTVPVAVVYELGPQTLATIQALIAALSK